MSLYEEIKPRRKTFSYRRMNSPYLKKRVVYSDREQAERLQQVADNLKRSLSHVIRTFDCRESPEYFPSVISLLESLPLATSEFGLARNRIHNARRYAESEEPGAAVYELRMLLRWLQTVN